MYYQVHHFVQSNSLAGIQRRMGRKTYPSLCDSGVWESVVSSPNAVTRCRQSLITTGYIVWYRQPITANLAFHLRNFGPRSLHIATGKLRGNAQVANQSQPTSHSTSQFTTSHFRTSQFTYALSFLYPSRVRVSVSFSFTVLCLQRWT